MSHVVCVLVLLMTKLCVYFAQSVADDTVTVDISQGTLKGRTLTTEAGVSYYSFQGIPYAQPPVGKQRFRPPGAPPSWDSTRDATQQGSVCPQSDFFNVGNLIGNEDCLFINVYTPQLPTSASSPNLSVMVWIHGGAFSILSGNTDFFGPDYLMNENNVIIVTFNYRLGVLGFLGLNHSDVSKNNGLKDQVAALTWVRNNIENFGGNPNDVTIFGESAGGASVHYQLLSPLSKGLFHKAIAESGSALEIWAYVDPVDAHNRAVVVANILANDTGDISDALSLLLEADAFTLVEVGNSVPAPLSIPTMFGATLLFTPTTESESDTAFLTDIPRNILKSGKFNQVPLIIGATSAEGKTFALGLHLDPENWPYYEEHFEEMYVPVELGLERGSPKSVQDATEIKELYFGNESLSEHSMQQMVELAGDYGIVVGVHRAVQLQLATGNSPIYIYIFSYVGQLSQSEIQHYNYSFKGAAHGDDTSYIFKQYIFNATVDPDSTEMQTVHHMTKLWTNFARTGSPTSNMNISWDPLSAESKTYLNIDSELIIEQLSDFEPERIALWEKLFEDVDSLS